MNSKRCGITFFLLFITYAASAGSYLNTGNQLAYEYAYIYALLDLVIVSVSMMLIPFFIWIVRRKKLTYKSGKIICICNSIFVFLVINIIAIEYNIGSIGGVSAIFYYFINKWLFVEEKNPVEELNDISISLDSESIKSETLPATAETPLFNRLICNKCKKELPCNSVFCNYCGNPISNETSKGMGKISSKTKNTLMIFLVIAMVIVSLVFMLHFFLINDSISTNDNTATTTDTNTYIDNTTTNNDIITDTQDTTTNVEQGYEITFSQYTFASFVSYDTQEYCDYIIELDSLINNDSYSENNKKEKVSEYINNLPLDYGQKIILYRISFPDDNTYNSDIVDYLNERSDITYEQMAYILEELGFVVYEDGTVKW